MSSSQGVSCRGNESGRNPGGGDQNGTRGGDERCDLTVLITKFYFDKSLAYKLNYSLAVLK